ncbi:DUF523 domain-containing protein [Murinocardiopsis flavida]|uniref:DUF523 domain-containing protein n=1 Tax=Murinocardiopsis flavida TaxID=645275 RepID=UPI000D0D6FA0|nr:DUF523 domain-containing protein [Murinocardiopsis flavida]
MEKILVSACLLGQRVRYDGAGKATAHAEVARWRAEGRLVSYCPEVAGGLPVPRPPAEIEAGGTAAAVLDGSARIITPAGADVTEVFLAGAHGAVRAARRHGTRIAVLKEGSPSCGVHRVHDGTFSGTTIDGSGVTAHLLRAAGVAVFSESEIDAAAAHLAALASP